MKIDVLDHGYVELIEVWGHGKGDSIALNPGQEDYECGIIEAARQSTQGSFRGWDEDAKLLETLFYHQPNQSTPFEAAGMTIEVQAPIFVFREWHRHRTQSYNEASARYIPLPDLYYMPMLDNVIERTIAAAKSKNKQSGSTTDFYGFGPSNAEAWSEEVQVLYDQAEAVYKRGLDRGIPKELADGPKRAGRNSSYSERSRHDC